MTSFPDRCHVPRLIFRIGFFRRVVLGITIGAVAGCAQPAINVRIRNETGANVSSVEVRYSGGEYTVEELSLSETDSRYIYPESDSHLDLEYRQLGQLRRAKIDTYFTHGMIGSIEVVLRSDSVVWSSNLEVKGAEKNSAGSRRTETPQ